MQIATQLSHPQNRLHAGHFAFMRAVVQGMDATASWLRYLRPEGRLPRPREVAATIAWVRDAFAAAAKRHGRPGTARLVLMDLDLLKTGESSLPSLESVASDQDLDGFSETEQLSLYQRHYGKLATRRSRQSRLMVRQLEAVHWLQQVLPEVPHGSDPISHWIDPHLAIHLAKQDLLRLDQLVSHVNRIGHRWWRGIASIGAAKAGRIVAWLKANEVTLGTPIGVHVTDFSARRSVAQRRQAVAPETAIVPLEKLRMPPEFDTAFGMLRESPERCLVAATSDVEALRVWIHARQPQTNLAARIANRTSTVVDPGAASSGVNTVPGWEIVADLSNTQRAYWREAERFLLWLVLEKRTTLSAVSIQECIAYANFLKNPGPHWCGVRGHDKGHPLWRPFEGPLAPASQRFALGVLRGMYRYLVRQHYLKINPWDQFADLISAQIPVYNPRLRSRAFSAAAWQCIEVQLAHLPDTSVNRRLQLAISMLRGSRIRLGEAVRATVDDLLARPDCDNRWDVKITSDAQRVRTVALTPETVIQLQDDFRARGLDATLAAPRNCGAHLLGRAVDARQRAPWAPCAREPLDIKAGVGAGMMRDQIRDFFRLCASANIACPEIAAQFEAATSQWLRADSVMATD